MRFSRLAIENWRNFNLVDVRLHARAFLVGPNASGKSNFLDTFRFLSDLVSTGGGLQSAVERRGGLKKIRCLSARRYPHVRIEVVVTEKDQSLAKADEWRYRLVFSVGRKTKGLSVIEEVVQKGDEEILNRPLKEDREDPLRLSQTYLEQVSRNKDFRPLADFFASIKYLHLVPQLVREPKRYLNPSHDPYGGRFLEELAKHPDKKERDKRIDTIRNALQSSLPQFEKLKLNKDEIGVPHLKALYKHWRPRGAWQDESDFSDGTIRLLGFLWALLDSAGPLLLEEPELSLHPELVQRLPQIMTKIQIRRRNPSQIIVSTHSYDLLRDEGIAADEVFLFLPTDEGTEVKSGLNLKDVKKMMAAGLSAAEVVIPRTGPPKIKQLSLFPQ